MKTSLKTIFSILTTVCILSSSTLPVLAATTTTKNPLVQPTMSITKVKSNVYTPSVTPNASGLTVHGSWWGPTTHYDNISDGLTETYATFLIGWFGIPGLTAKQLALGTLGVTVLSAGKPYYGFGYKYYEEMYSNGEFAYYRTTLYNYVFSDPEYYYKIGEASITMTSMSPMVLSN